MTGTRTFETAAYSRQGITDLALDVFRPTADSRRCAILLIHGGAWRAGAKEDVHQRAAALAAAGFTAVTAQYRLLDAAPWPAPLNDATAALTWVRSNAERLNVDPRHVAVQGHSAGAHIALMTGTLASADRPAAIAAYYPPIGFYSASAPPPPPGPTALPSIEFDDLGRVPSWMLLPPGAGQADLEAASPFALLDEDFPPTIIFHGTADRTISPRSSMALHERLSELGVPSDLHLYAGRAHEFDMAPSMTAATVAAATSFFERTVTNAAESEAEARRYPFPPSAD